jgi:histidinol-phosphate aminotransferase
VVDLSDNTSLFGAPPSASRVLRDSDPAAITRYPSPSADDLRAALAGYHGVPPECVVTGCGSDSVLDGAFRAFANPGDAIAYHDPTFSMIPAFARMNALEPAPIACAGAPDERVVQALFDTGARIVYLCAPNNPTGAVASPGACDAARARLRAAPRPPLLLLDQAYAEFAEPGGVPCRRFGLDEPVLVTRTLSKAFGLAGLRVGYGIGPAEIVREIEKIRGPYQVGGLAERAAVAALTCDRAWVRARAADVLLLRERFAERLRSLGFAPLPSAANFLLVPVASAPDAAAALARAGVAVRAFTALTGIGDALRVTIGPWPMMEACLAAWRGVRP